jgi:hypothetical protein
MTDKTLVEAVVERLGSQAAVSASTIEAVLDTLSQMGLLASPPSATSLNSLSQEHPSPPKLAPHARFAFEAFTGARTNRQVRLSVIGRRHGRRFAPSSADTLGYRNDRCFNICTSASTII